MEKIKTANTSNRDEEFEFDEEKHIYSVQGVALNISNNFC